MAKKRTTFGKLQRERDKQQKQMAKRDRRINRDDDADADGTDDAPAVEYDEAQTLAALAALHEAFDDGRIGLEDFEAQRDELRARLQP